MTQLATAHRITALTMLVSALAGCGGAASNDAVSDNAVAANAAQGPGEPRATGEPVNCVPIAPIPGARVADAYIRLPVIADRPGALYARISTGAYGDIRLVAVRSPAFREVQLHETVEANGVSGMRPLADPSFGACRDLVLEPGGKHGMVMGIGADVRAGARVPVTFVFEGAPEVTVPVEVRPFGGDSGGHAGH